MQIAGVAILVGCDPNRVQQKELAQKNPTTYTFNASVEEMQSAIRKAFGSVESYPYLSLIMNGYFDKGVDFFQIDGNENDALLRSTLPIKSPVYYRCNQFLDYKADFHLHLKAVDQHTTAVEVCTLEPRVSLGRTFALHGSGKEILVAVPPTTIEEYKLLLAVGHVLGATDMPSLHLPAPNEKPFGTEVHEAIRRGEIDKLTTFLERKPKVVNERDQEQQTPLQVAADRCNSVATELLLAKNADVNAKGNMGWTPLHLATQRSCEEVVQILLAKGANVNARDEWGNTPLCLIRSTSIGALLFAKGADVNTRSFSDSTPLHTVAGYSTPECVEWLIAQGAELNVTDKRGETPLDVAIRFNQSANAAILREHGGRSSGGGS